MGFKLGGRSKEKLKDVKPALAKVVARAIELSEVDFTVVQGNRTQKYQDELYAQGRTKPGPIVTKTRKSNHIGGGAVDLYPWINGKPYMPDRPTKKDFEMFKKIKVAMFAAAAEQGTSIRWGADWDKDGATDDETFVDMPHFELYNK